MEFNDNLYNAAMIGENSESAFIVEGNRLHAVEESIADLKSEKCKPELMLPLMREALEALLKFAEGKLPPHLADKFISLKTTEQEQLIEKIEMIFTHLHHNDRNYLSSMIHHKQPVSKGR